MIIIDVVYVSIAPKLLSFLTCGGSSYATACDIVQETFLRLWKQREHLKDDPVQLSGLVFTIARNYRNDLARKARRECLQADFNDEGADAALPEGLVAAAPSDLALDADGGLRLRRRLKAALGRMPTPLLEAFMLSRIGDLSGKDIARHLNTSEANVKVRVHRAKELFRKIFAAGEDTGPKMREPQIHDVRLAVLKAMVMLAAVDGQVTKAELALFKEQTEALRAQKSGQFDLLWQSAVRSASYLGFLSGEITREEMAAEFVREAGPAFAASMQHVSEECRRRVFATLKRMAEADGDYSAVERLCILTLLDRSHSGDLRPRPDAGTW